MVGWYDSLPPRNSIYTVCVADYLIVFISSVDKESTDPADKSAMIPIPNPTAFAHYLPNLPYNKL